MNSSCGRYICSILLKQYLLSLPGISSCSADCLVPNTDRVVYMSCSACSQVARDAFDDGRKALAGIPLLLAILKAALGSTTQI